MFILGNILIGLGNVLDILLSIYMWIVIIGALISWVNPDPSNPIIRFLGNMTRPLWNWLQGVLPASLRLFSAYISLLLVWFLKIFAPGTLRAFGRVSADMLPVSDLPGVVAGFFLLGVGVVVQSLLFFLMLLLVIWFVLTLVNPSVNNPIVRTLFVLVDPFITPIQRRLPRQRIDISPLLAAGIFLLLNLLVVSPLVRMAAELTLGSGFAGPIRTF